MTTIDNPRATIRRLGVALAWGALLFGPMLRAESLEQEVEARWGKSFAHLVWTHRWATFAETSRVAARLGYSQKEYEAAMKRHPWLLQPPPALLLAEKGVRTHLCEAPCGPFRQMRPDPFFLQQQRRRLLEHPRMPFHGRFVFRHVALQPSGDTRRLRKRGPAVRPDQMGKRLAPSRFDLLLD